MARMLIASIVVMLLGGVASAGYPALVDFLNGSDPLTESTRTFGLFMGLFVAMGAAASIVADEVRLK